MKDKEDKSNITTTSKKLGTEDKEKTIVNDDVLIISFNQFVELGSTRVHKHLDNGKKIIIQTLGKSPITVKKINYSF